MRRPSTFPFLLGNARSLACAKDGNTIILFCVLLPVFLLLIVAVVEFGWYFIKDETVVRSVSITALAIQANPSSTSLQSLANGSGNFYTYGKNGNYICAMSYATLAAAQTQLCQSGEWDTGLPAGLSAGTVYYVAVKGYVAPFTLTNLLPYLNTAPIAYSEVVQTGTSQPPAQTPPTSQGWVNVETSQQNCRASRMGPVCTTTYTPSYTFNTTPDPDQVCQSNNYHHATGNCFSDSNNGSKPGALITNAQSNSWYCAVEQIVNDNQQANTGEIEEPELSMVPPYKILCE